MNTNIIWKTKSFDELTAEELYKIVQARLEVFVVEQEAIYQDLDNADLKAIHLWAEKDGNVIAYCRLFDKGIKYQEASIGRVLTPPNERGKNYGRLLVKFAVETIENRFRTSKIRISAQDYLIKFYEEFGFISTDKKYLEDKLPHTEMYRN